MVIDCLEYTNSEISVKFSILMVNNVNWFHHIRALSSKLKLFCPLAAVFQIPENNFEHKTSNDWSCSGNASKMS